MYQVVIFDFDGTIADSDPVVNKILGSLIAKYGLEQLSPKDFKHKSNLPLLKKLRMLLFIKKVAPEFKKMYGENVGEIKAFDHMIEVLRETRKEGLRVAILSSNARNNVEKWFELSEPGLGLTVLSSGGLFGKHKAIKRFLQKNGLRPEDALYVGDEIRDVLACNRAGVDIAFVCWGLDKDEDLSAYDIKYRIKTPSELTELLKR